MEQSANLYVAEFYHKYYRQLYVIAYSILGKEAEAEVAVQESFAVACQKTEELMLSENPIMTTGSAGGLKKPFRGILWFRLKAGSEGE